MFFCNQSTYYISFLTSVVYWIVYHKSLKALHKISDAQQCYDNFSSSNFKHVVERQIQKQDSSAGAETAQQSQNTAQIWQAS